MLTTIEKNVRPNSGGEKFQVIARELQARVLNGVWAPGQKVSSENELAQEFMACRSTIKKSLRELELEGLLVSRRGKGRFVVDMSSRQRSWAIGVLLFDQRQIICPVMAERFAGIQKVVDQAGYHLNILAMHTSSRGDFFNGVINPGNVDGVIVLAQRADKLQVERLSQAAPIVWLDHSTVSSRIQGVQEDHLGGAFLAGKHLVELGHKKVALLAADETFSIAVSQRDGLRLAMREVTGAGDGCLSTLFGDAEFTVENGRKLGERFLKMDDRPTAIVCGSDELAIGIYQVLSEAGLSVPQDISIIGWNNTIQADQIPIKMTSVKLPFCQVAAHAAQKLLDMIEAGAKRGGNVEDEVIPAELVVGDSTSGLV